MGGVMTQRLPANLEQLLKDLKHTDPIRRKMTAKTLGKYGNGYEVVIRELRGVAQSDHEIEVRGAAIESLKCLGDEAFANSLVLPQPPTPLRQGNVPTLDFDPDAKPFLPEISFMPEIPSRMVLYGFLGVVAVVLLLLGDFIGTLQVTESLTKAASLLCVGAGGLVVLACVIMAGVFGFANRASFDLRDVGMIGLLLGSGVVIGAITAVTAYALWTTHYINTPSEFIQF